MADNGPFYRAQLVVVVDPISVDYLVEYLEIQYLEQEYLTINAIKGFIDKVKVLQFNRILDLIMKMKSKRRNNTAKEVTFIDC